MEKQPLPRLTERTLRLRDHINRSRVNSVLARDFRTFNQLCTCLDTIDDTEMVIEAFLDGSDDDTGDLYLALYGFLQALFVQQDAVHHLCDSFGVTYTGGSHPDIKKARDVRNDAIGHPTERKRNKEGGTVSFHSISRSTMRRTGFMLVSEYAHDESRTYHHVNTVELWEKQAPALCDILDAVIVAVEEQDRQYREAHMSTKLADIVSASKLSYDFEKVLGALRGEMWEMGELGIERIAQAIVAFRDELQRRDLPPDAYPGIKYIYEEIEHPLSVALSYFSVDTAPYMPLVPRGVHDDEEEAPATEIAVDEQTMRVFVEYIEYKVRELREAAESIDQDFAGTTGEEDDNGM